MKPRIKKAPSINLNLNVRGLSQSATLAINERSARLQAEGREVFKLGLGQSPFPVPDCVVESLREHAHQKAYLPVKDLPALREPVAQYHCRKQGADCTSDDILIGPGSKELMFLLQLVYYGDLVIPIPSWVSYAPQAQTIRRHIRWLRDALAAVASETYTTTSSPIQYAAVMAFNGGPELETYLVHSRRILRALGRHLTSRLQDASVTVSEARRGFYLFPNFSSFQQKLRKRGITTSPELSDQLKDTGVAILPGTDFGRCPKN